MDPILERYQALEDKVAAYTPNLDTKRLFDAFTYADTEHHGQLRKSGEPYIIHPLAVADIVADLGLDVDSVIAALLHDCIEDTDATHEEIAKKFGKSVAELVEGVTKLTRVQYVSKEEEQMENLRKMLMAMAHDIRVILIKICDRLHNMRTMEYQSPRKQREKSLETMEIYAPLAHRLGMQKLKWELEDLSLRYLDPVGYKEIEEEMSARSAAHEEFLASIQLRIQQRMEQEGIRCKVYGRVKHTYSIYRKMFAQNKTLDEIFDLYAFRVIVDDIPECYNVLGCIHDMFKPVLGRFKDYIGTPKPNMYQSLHTTVIGREGIPFEVQIRTWEMHQTAEYGIAAHWKYKQGMANKKLGSEVDFEWVRKLLESQQDTDAEEFVRTLKVDMFSDEVFVSVIIRIDCHCRITKQSLRTGGCDLHITTSVSDRIIDVPEMSSLLLMLYLCIRDGRMTYRTPVNDSGTFVDVSFLIETGKYFQNCLRASFIHGETLSVPVTGGTNLL